MKTKLVLFFTVLFVLVGCATSPTGRKQFIGVSDDQMQGLGEEGFEEMKKKLEIAKDPAINRYIQCITKPLVEQLDEGGDYKDWEVVVFKDDSANAFALPGKKIGVHTGIIKLAPTDDHLASVIGHEIGHVIARHSHERVSQQVAAQTGLQIAEGLLSGKNPAVRQVTLGALGLGTQFGILMRYSRQHETEADEIGQNLMAKAGFEPKAAVEFWRLMQENSGGSPPEFLSTHPSSTTRIETLSENLGAANELYREAQAKGQTPNCERPN